MKKTFITSEGQNIYDVALTLYGSIEGVVEVLKDNQHTINSIDSVLTAGTKIIYDTDKVIRKDVQRYLSEKGIIANTGDVPVPVAPSDLTAIQTPNIIGSITLNWSDNSGDEQAFELWRKPQGTGTVYAKVASLPADSTSYEDTELDDGRAYDYQIRAINGIGFSDFSNEATASTLAPVLDFYVLDDSLLSITKTGVPEQWKHSNGRSKLFIFDDISTVTGFSSVSRDETTQDVTATAGITGTLNFSQFTHLTTIDAPDQDFDILFGSWVQQPNINVDISNSLITVFPAVKNAINSLITANGGDNTALDESGNYDPSQAGQTHANRIIKIGTVTEPIIFDTTNPEMKLLWEKIMALGTDGIEGVGFFISTVNQLCLKFITFDTGDTFEATTYLEQTTEILETDKVGGDDMVLQLYPTEADAIAKTNLITEGRPYINNHLKTKIWSEGEKMGLRVFAIDTESVSNKMEMTYKAFPTGERACGIEIDVRGIEATIAWHGSEKLQLKYLGNEFFKTRSGVNMDGLIYPNDQPLSYLVNQGIIEGVRGNQTNYAFQMGVVSNIINGEYKISRRGSSLSWSFTDVVFGEGFCIGISARLLSFFDNQTLTSPLVVLLRDQYATPNRHYFMISLSTEREILIEVQKTTKEVIIINTGVELDSELKTIIVNVNVDGEANIYIDDIEIPSDLVFDSNIYDNFSVGNTRGGNQEIGDIRINSFIMYKKFVSRPEVSLTRNLLNR